MGFTLFMGTMTLVAIGIVLAKRNVHRRSARGDVQFVYSEHVSGEAGPRVLSSGGGVVDGGGRPVQVAVDKTMTSNQWTLWTPVDAPSNFLSDLTPPNDVDARLRTKALDQSIAELHRRERPVSRLSVSEGWLHVNFETGLFDASRQESVVDLIDASARGLVKVARNLDEAFARGGFETRSCPRCRHVALEMRAGPLGDDRCPTCSIHFLDAEHAARLCDELHVNAHELKGAIVEGRTDASCAVCKMQMAPVLVEHTIIDLCRGCGAILLDEGELRELMPRV
jgi:Zn-finger nucleic acid-binding protein